MFNDKDQSYLQAIKIHIQITSKRAFFDNLVNYTAFLWPNLFLA